MNGEHCHLAVEISRHDARPSRFDARRALLRAAAPRSAMASWHLRAFHAPSPLTIIQLAGSLEPVALTGSMAIRRCKGPATREVGS
jgi:hypothetical protein